MQNSLVFSEEDLNFILLNRIKEILDNIDKMPKKIIVKKLKALRQLIDEY